MVDFSSDGYAWHIESCGIRNAWEKWGHGCNSFAVAIVDSGIDIREGMARDHLRHKVVAGYGCLRSGRGQGDVKRRSSCFFDYNGHGTMMAGLVAADSRPAIGGSAQSGGVAGCTGVAKDVSLLNFRVADDFGDICKKDLQAAAERLREVARPRPRRLTRRGRRPVEISRVGIALFGFDDRVWTKIGVREVGRAFGELSKADILAVVSAGDRRMDVAELRAHPANLHDRDKIIVVSGHDETGSLLERSNFGAGVDLAAPAANLLTVGPRSAGLMTGTSGAAAIVAGVAALLWCHLDLASAAQVKREILERCAKAQPKLQDKVNGNRTLYIE